MEGEEVLVIRDPAVAKLLADETRRRILSLLRHAEMTPQQLARALGKNVSSIVHHLSILEQGGLVRVVRVSRRGNLVAKWYRAAARRIIVSYELAEGLVPGSEDYAAMLEERIRSAVAVLVKAAPQLSGNVDELVELIRRVNVMWMEAYQRAIERTPREGDPCSRDTLAKVLALLTLHARPEGRSALDRLAQLLGDLVEQGQRSS